MGLFRGRKLKAYGREKGACRGQGGAELWGSLWGFTLVELMVTVAIVAILAAVAIPAYVNSVRRSEQAHAVEALLRARMELEAYWADHNRYAQTLTLLPSFESAIQGKYVISLRVWADGQRYRVDAVRADVGDRLHLSDNETKPVVDTPKALGWSIFQWLFE
ncbi:type IV pilin protein [Desulfosoma sp.]